MFQSLAPGFLIASPPLGDPNFDRTVVMLAVHNEDGALGFVVNRESPLSVGELLSAAGYDEGHDESTPVWVGGPVQPQSGWVISDEAHLGSDDDVIEVDDTIRISSSRSAFDQLAKDAAAGSFDAQRILVLLGYSGWGPNQLEGEIARGAWLPTPLDETVLFEVAPEERWEKAYALLGLTPTHMMTMRTVGEA